MDRSNDKLLLKKILSRYDQLGFIRKQIFESKENLSSIEKLRQQSCKQINEIDREFKEHESQGPLATLLKRYRLDKYQLVIILALLRQRLVSSNPSLTGRELLQLIFDESYGILQGMALIDSTSILVSTGIIIPEISSGEIDELLDNINDRGVTISGVRWRESIRARRRSRWAPRPRRPWRRSSSASRTARP